ncbi:MAG: oligosaccharide flippase family protein, partial [Fibrobacter sp.]|nr:oligosaccharide flippase family protein [Fibrobacter sp.]
KIYHCQELALVLRYLSFNILIGSFGTIQTVLLTKSINFKQQTKVSVLTTLVSGLFGVILAYLGFGVWSLVGQALLRSISYTTLMWLTYEWRPILKFSISSLSSMFKFGSMILLNSLFKLIFQNIYTILIGIYYSPAMLGIYTRAKQTQQLPVDTIWAILGRVIFPVISKIKNDNERIVSAIKDISNNIAFFVFPFLIIGMMVSDELFIIVFGSAWKPSIIYFKILCIGSIFYPLEYLKNNVLMAKGKTDVAFKINLIRNMLILITILIINKYGIKMMLIFNALISYLFFIVSSLFIKKYIGYTLYKQIKDVLPFVLCTLLAALNIFLIQKFTQINSIFFLFIVKLAIGLVSYLMACYFLKIKTLFDNLSLLFNLFKRQRLTI